MFSQVAKKDEEIDDNMVYTIGAYHDIGCHIDRKNHEEVSAEMLAGDKRLKRFFGHSEITTMAEAVADHRSSLYRKTGTHPRSTYGKIVSTADKRIITHVDWNELLDTSWLRKNFPNNTHEQNAMSRLDDLMQRFGLIPRLEKDIRYFDDPEYSAKKDEIAKVLLDMDAFLKVYADVHCVTEWNNVLLTLAYEDMQKYLANELAKANSHEKDTTNST